MLAEIGLIKNTRVGQFAVERSIPSAELTRAVEKQKPTDRN